jgi:hypothetical protein
MSSAFTKSTPSRPVFDHAVVVFLGARLGHVDAVEIGAPAAGVLDVRYVAGANSGSPLNGSVPFDGDARNPPHYVDSEFQPRRVDLVGQPAQAVRKEARRGDEASILVDPVYYVVLAVSGLRLEAREIFRVPAGVYAEILVAVRLELRDESLEILKSLFFIYIDAVGVVAVPS